MSPLVFGALCMLLNAIWQLYCRKTTHKPPPPGPRGLPIIGNLHMLGSHPHRTLSQLSKKYGPIMSLCLGKVPTVVVSSAKAAEIFLKTHDDIFAGRPQLQFSQNFPSGYLGLVFQQYGAYWRNIRKFCTLKLLSSKKNNALAGMRREELGFLVEEVKAAAEAREVVDLSKKVAQLIEDMISKVIFGRCNEKFNLKNKIDEIFDLAGAFNIADYVPWLAVLDLQGLTRRMRETTEALDKILEAIIKQHEQNPWDESSTQDADFVDIMLSQMQKPDDNSLTINRENMKAIVMEMISAGIDTSHVSIQWILSELMRNPRTMRKLQEELDHVVGRNKIVEESDLSNLSYLAMVVKEGLRLHPAVPLLLPHESLEDSVINSFFIPKGSRVIINAWAIGRDPNSWPDNADEFLPERFVESKIDVRGRDFQLIPFGSGRRGCPGIHIGITTVQLVVAQLVHSFDWQLPEGSSPSNLDMTEVFGLSTPRAKHLLAVPTYRL